MILIKSLKLPLGLLLLLATSCKAQLPYSPTSIFLSSQASGDFIYILDLPNTATPHGQLRSLTTKGNLSSNSLPSSIVSTSLPFLADDPSLAFTPVLNSDGGITVYAGNCSGTSSTSSLWKFTPSPVSFNGSGTWSKETYTVGDSIEDQTLTAPNYLSAGMAFTPDDIDPENIYFFGGMCPFPNATMSSWTSSASYSSQMLVFGAQSFSVSGYNLSLIRSQGQPIPEAGFSITPLQPTFSNASDGTQAIQRDFVLIGGHTETAFIDMNKVAMFSLPQASWTFLLVDPPSASTDLLTRTATAQLDPRSGHTAVLTLDGTKIIVFGGWVGDITSPATPQLAVLDIGQGFGGAGDWKWNIPSTTGSSLPAGAGVYGHGAVMLPGDIMMISGGYNIPAATSSRLRRAEQAPNLSNFFFNVSSSTWIPYYDPFAATVAGVGEVQSSGPLSTKAQQAGLGAGLGLGALAIALAILVGCIYSHRLKRRRKARVVELHEKEIADFGAAAHPPHGVYEAADMQHHGESTIVPGRWDGSYGSGDSVNLWSAGYSDDLRRWNSPSRGAERTGLDFDVPSPQRGLRRSLSGRGNHYAAQRQDDDRTTRGLGNIHPIAEGDEDDSTLGRGKLQIRTAGLYANVPNLDPFRDPDFIIPSSKFRTLRRVPTHLSRPGPSSPVQERHGWIRNWAVADSIVNATDGLSSERASSVHGRVSPNKSDRTESNLSDRSMQSAVSSISADRVNLYAAPSQRSRQLVHSNPFRGSPNPSPTKDSFALRRSPTSASRPSTEGADGDSFKTAHSTFATLQVESEALLGSSVPATACTETVFYPDTEPTFTRFHNPVRLNPIRNTSHTRRIGGWVGSVRRAMPRALHGGRSSSLTLATTRTALLADPHGGYTDFPEADERSTSSSPTKLRQLRGPPFDAEKNEPKEVRRSVSDGASLLLGRRSVAHRAVTFAGVAGPGNAAALRSVASRDTNGSEDWDVENAVEGRVVQVLYTVPREKLRVVNADVVADGESVSDATQGQTQDEGVAE